MFTTVESSGLMAGCSARLLCFSAGISCSCTVVSGQLHWIGGFRHYFLGLGLLFGYCHGRSLLLRLKQRLRLVVRPPLRGTWSYHCRCGREKGELARLDSSTWGRVVCGRPDDHSFDGPLRCGSGRVVRVYMFSSYALTLRCLFSVATDTSVKNG